MTTTWKIAAQVGLVLLAGGALMLSGGVASALPGQPAPPGGTERRALAECAVLQLPGVDVQLGEPRSCLSVLLPSSVGAVGAASLPAATAAPAPAPASAGPPVVPPVGAASPPVQRFSPPYPCLAVSLPGLRVSVGDASPPTRCLAPPAP